MTTVYPWRDAPAAEFAVIGDPIDHSLSPQMHEAAYAVLGMPYHYLAIQVPPGEVAPALTRLRSIGYRGINVTVPHKEEAIEWCLHVDGFCEQVRAVNTIDLERRAGINTDANGFLTTLDGVPVRSALLLGAGGSARALARALVRDGWIVRIWNRTHEKAVELARLAGAAIADEPDPTGASLILNTTSASLTGDDLPILWDRVEKDALAYDLAYSSAPTPFLKVAAAHGLPTMDGLRMLVEQGALSLEWWTGARAPRDAMLSAVRAALPPTGAV